MPHLLQLYLKRVIPVVILFPIALFPQTSIRDPSSKNKSYIGKDYIDTTVQRGIYLMSDAATVAGVGFRQKEAIEAAKRIAQQLKAEVKGDANEKYALWKINELEWLIYLEEKDIVLQKVKQGQMTVQQLITDFNAELGRPRPDFKALARLQTSMGDYDRRQADEMTRLMDKRGRTIGRDAAVAVEKSLMCGDAARAKEDFRYCLRNSRYLGIPDAKFAQLEARVSACERARDELPIVKNMSGEAQELLGGHRLGEARAAVADAINRLVDIRGCVPEAESGPFAAQCAQVEPKIDKQEDSLVAVNLDVLKKKGVEAANEYLQSVLVKAGVCHEKTARVDKAILAVSSPLEKNKVSGEIDEVAESDDHSGDIFAEMRKKAKIRAQDKLDSIQIAKEERERAIQAHLDSVDAAARKEAALEFERNQEPAKLAAAEIYSLIEKNKARAAFDLFTTKKSVMGLYLAPEAFAMLEATVKQAVDPSWAASSSEIAYLAPLSTAPENVSSEPSKVDENKKKAEETIAQVYSMLEHNDAKGAAKTFKKEKKFLQAHLDKESYEMLDATVNNTNK